MHTPAPAPNPDHLDQYERMLTRILVAVILFGLACLLMLGFAIHMGIGHYRDVMRSSDAAVKANAARYDQIDRRLDAIADTLGLAKPEHLVTPPPAP